VLQDPSCSASNCQQRRVFRKWSFWFRGKCEGSALSKYHTELMRILCCTTGAIQSISNHGLVKSFGCRSFCWVDLVVPFKLAVGPSIFANPAWPNHHTLLHALFRFHPANTLPMWQHIHGAFAI
jgi:hypothetical protein